MGVGEAVGKLLFRPFVRRFIAGETPEEGLRTVQRFNRQGVGGILSSLGEHVQTRAAARHGVEEYRRVLELLDGADADGCISVKPTHMGAEIDAEVTGSNMLDVVDEARDRDIFVWVDMERSTFTDLTIDVFESMQDAYDRVGICLQANLKRTPKDLERLLARDAPIRLVKGAYDEPAEIAHRDKARVDEAYLDLLERLFRQGPDTGFAVATHDPQMIARAKELDEEHGGEWEFQMLLGVRDDAKPKLVEAGYRVQAYIPFGPDWFPYYWRRIQERRENVWFALRAALGR